MQEHRLPVRRTARYVTLGPADGSARETWFVLHGYGQLAPRFARSFAPIDDGSRLVVVPEGLSRYYVDHSGQRVGASWMTREERRYEIDDYVAFLDAVHAAAPPSGPLTVLGFSQGSATAWRWLAQGAGRPQRLIVWGGEIPPDLDWAAVGPRVAGVEVVLVAGTTDEYATPDRMRAYERLLAQRSVRHRSLSFEGGHWIDEETLRAVATSA